MKRQRRHYSFRPGSVTAVAFSTARMFGSFQRRSLENNIWSKNISFLAPQTLIKLRKEEERNP